MMIDEKPPKANMDGSRPHTCRHGATATPLPAPLIGAGWWRNYALNCKPCGGDPAGLPYIPGPALKN